MGAFPAYHVYQPFMYSAGMNYSRTGILETYQTSFGLSREIASMQPVRAHYIMSWARKSPQLDPR